MKYFEKNEFSRHVIYQSTGKKRNAILIMNKIDNAFHLKYRHSFLVFHRINFDFFSLQSVRQWFKLNLQLYVYV